MRQRKIKNEDEKIAAFSRYIIEEPESWKGRWAECFVQKCGEAAGAKEPATDGANGGADESAGNTGAVRAASAETMITANGTAHESAGNTGAAGSGGFGELKEPEEKKEIYLEIGCGKGRFITTLAQRNPDKRYIAVEGARSVALRALEKADEKGLSNLVFILDYVNDLEDLFQRGEVAGIYLNFSDPWPKDRHAKRRLTHSRYLQSYKRILKPGSFIEFKTDNDGLFAFSAAEMRENGLEIVEYTEDLHASVYGRKNVPTEYEDKFRKLWKKINYCKARV